MSEADALMQVARHFGDRDVCERYMREIRWPGGMPVCPACGATGDRIGAIATRRTLRCRDCRKQFSSQVGSIFEDSPLGMDKWFVAIWAIANCKITSVDLGRALGVTQKTAWSMIHRIRLAMASHRGAAVARTKPGGWAAFDRLARRLAKTSKVELDQMIAGAPKRRRRSRHTA